MILNRCEACKKFSEALVRFNVTKRTEENLFFGDELSYDIMLLEWKANPHVEVTASTFFADTFLDSHGMNFGQFVEGIWLGFVMT